MVEEKKLTSAAIEFAEDLRKRYGFNKSDMSKWLPSGCEIMKLVGMEVVYIDYFKNDQGEWNNTVKRAILKNISDYDPMTVTYKVDFSIVNEDGSFEERSERIYPEGISFGNPEETGKMFRLNPTSLHCKSIEEEEFYNRLFIIESKNDTLSLESIKTITDSASKDKTLKYACNIMAVIKLYTGEVLGFRINDILLRHTHKDSYKLILTDENNKSLNLNISSEDKLYELTYGKDNIIGTVKVIDLAGK